MTTVLITGGSGSFGKAFTRFLLEATDWPIRVFSRGELAQAQMREEFGDDRIRYLIGDVRDLDRLQLAMKGVNIVVHAAALKRIEVCHYNPFEAVQTNILGTQNVLRAAIDQHIYSFVGLTTDKAAAPVNLYGSTKMVAEHLISHANVYSSFGHYAAVRYGNVVGSNGSVVHAFRRQAQEGMVRITDLRMNRFWLPMEQAVKMVWTAIGKNGIFVPKAPSVWIKDVAEAIAPGVPIDVVGANPGERLYETLVTPEEAPRAEDRGEYFWIGPHECGGTAHYRSDDNEFLTVEGIRATVRS